MLIEHIERIQEALRREGIDGWLFFDHHRRDPLAYRVLKFESAQSVSRRWYYLVPASGEPRALTHLIEAHVLDPLPGRKSHYAGWQQQRHALSKLLESCPRVAMQYSPECAIPYVSNVDAGTVELIRGLGVEVLSSAPLVQEFEACLTEQQYQSHKQAGAHVDRIRAAAFSKAAAALRAGETLTEYALQGFIKDQFHQSGLFTDHGPIVAVNANASNPHYEPTADRHSPIRPGDLLLIDLWAKFDRPGAVYYDITWTGFCGKTPPEAMRNVFAAVAGARDAAVDLVRRRAEAAQPLAGFEVDDAARGHLASLGLAEHFVHRTGHSIGEDVHGNGANMDNFETHDVRPVVPGLCFSVEPGVYLPEFGIRSEVNVFRHAGSAEVTGEVQTALLSLDQ